MPIRRPAVFVAAAAILASTVPPWSAPRAAEPALSTQIVDAMNALFGSHPGWRANHAKGVVTSGQFTPSPEAATLSRAALFSSGTIPVTVRFSDATGVPDIADGIGDANPHGMAIKFRLANGKTVDWVINSLKIFPVATGEEFRDLLRAVAASPPGAPKPTPLDTFLGAHPKVGEALAGLHTPDSFADEQYNGVDAFIFVDRDGKRQAGRTMAVPERVVYLDPAEAAKRPPNYLVDELPARLAKGPVTFHLKVQLAEPGDVTKDPTIAWPSERKVVDVGTLVIDHADPDSVAAQKRLLFLPTNLTDGIELSDDPLIGLRTGAYAVSFARRNRP